MLSGYQQKRSFQMLGIAAVGVAMAAIFSLDCWGPQGIVWGLAYVFPVAASGKLQSKKVGIGASILCSSLVIVSAWIQATPEHVGLMVVGANKLLILAVIVMVAILFRSRKQTIGKPTAAKESSSEESQRAIRRSAELEKSNNELEQFIYIASHDLQEPLRMVAGYTQLLQRKYEGKFDERASRYMDRAVEGAKKMQRLILDLLKVSRARVTEVVIEEVEVAWLVENAKINLTHQLKASEATIQCRSSATAHVDASQIVVAFQSLFENSIKYRSATVPAIIVTCEEFDEHLLITVSDNGIGIAGSDRDKVFQPFQRVDPHSKVLGSGIGLTVAKRFIENHQGKIWVDSEQTEGTIFRIQLPRFGPKLRTTSLQFDSE
jgi:signal transduction histidine kinase